MSLLNKLERSLGRLALPHLPLYFVIGQVFFWVVAILAQFDIERITLLPNAVLKGEPWRLVTFLFVPPTLSRNALDVTLLAFGWYLFYLMANALEGYWGVFRFNLFVGLGWLLTVGVAFIFPAEYASNAYLGGSVFLAFAFLNPDFVLLLFFILPVKIKWLALLAWIGYGFRLLVGPWPARLLVLAAIGNFLVFFCADIVARIRTGRRRMAHQASVVAARRDEATPRHRCRVCGKTDLSDPQMDFRYCSKCAGNECYCADHIRNHEHVTADHEAGKPS